MREDTVPTRNNVLITGYPGTGKTTLIKRVGEALRFMHTVGFYLQPSRKGFCRRGERLPTASGGVPSMLSKPQGISTYNELLEPRRFRPTVAIDVACHWQVSRRPSLWPYKNANRADCESSNSLCGKKPKPSVPTTVITSANTMARE